MSSFETVSIEFKLGAKDISFCELKTLQKQIVVDILYPEIFNMEKHENKMKMQCLENGF